MPVPINPPWATTLLTGVEAPVQGGTVYQYDNRMEPTLEKQAFGILHNTPVTLMDLNYQFYSLYQFNEWVKKKQKAGILNPSSSRVLTPTDLGAYIKFSAATPTVYTVNAGVASLWDTVEIQQGGAGAITLTQGTGTVIFNVRAGVSAKTSGLNAKITMVKVSEGSGTESWDVYGDLGV